MSAPEPEVSLFALQVDTTETIMAVLDAGVRDPASEALTAVLQAAEAGAVIAARHAEPIKSSGMPPTRVSTVDELIAALGTAKLIAARSIWWETTAEAYLSEGRSLTLIQIRLPVAVFRHADEQRAADEQQPTEPARLLAFIPAGFYMIGEVGDIVMKFVGAAGVDLGPMTRANDTHPSEVAERLAAWAVEVEGFGASRCDAECSACRHRWYAEAGSWHFRPESDGTDWHYDDAYGFENNTIACPHCHTGRVGFTIG
jgi:hypothetical protein